MTIQRWIAAATGLAVALTLSACTSSRVVAGSEVRIAVAAPLTSLNAASESGRTSSTAAEVAELTGTGFGYRDASGALVLDESFGTAEIFALDPLTVQYTIAPGARWSDGVAVDAVDLLLTWAATSGALSDPGAGAEGADEPDPGVVFDGAATGGIAFATQTPQLGGERVLFVHFDRYLSDWQTVLAPGVAAHALAQFALDLDPDLAPEARAAEAKAAVSDAILTRDRVALAALAEAWNHALDVDDGVLPEPSLRVASGPYVVDELAEDDIVLRPNPEYDGDRLPAFETVRLRVVADPAEAIDLLRSGQLDVVPARLGDIAGDTIGDALTGLDGVRLEYGVETRIEHLDLQFDDARSGAFDDPLVREAFLLTIPRAALVSELLGEFAPDAVPLQSFVVGETSPDYAAVAAGNGSARFAEPDLVEAERLLAEAGQSDPRVCILFDADDPRRTLAFALIAESAAGAGFRVSDCSRSDWQSALGVAGAYDATLFAWDPQALGADALAAVYRSDSAIANLNRYANDEADRLIDLLATPLTPEERAAALAELDAELWSDAYGLPLFSYPTVTLVRDTVESVSPSPFTRGIAGNAWEWRPAP